MGETRLRIYVGGLGPNVKEDDLKKTFGSLGTVESVELNRNKGRSFGYMEFVPSSDKSLLKLFSAYNGCMWKGGKLKLEKAKEHYLSRLKREWNEEAEVAAAKLAKQNAVKEDEVVCAPTKFKTAQEMEKLQIKVYFHKLRKIIPLPYKGTGKHKYSFQRVEVPPLPINFCDCEEHSALSSANTKEFFQLPASAPISRNTKESFRPPVASAKRKDTNDIEPEAFMVTEQEVDIMKSVLNKLVEKENSSSKISNESKFTKKINHPVTSGDNSQVDKSEEDQASDDDDGDDDDDVVINVVGRSSKRIDPFEDWRPIATANQDSLSTEMESLTRSQKMKLQHDKKRKTPETATNDNHASKRMTSKDNLSLNSVPKTTESCSEAAPVRKTAWKNLMAEKGSTSFKISDILTDLNAKENKKDTEDILSDDQSMESAENESQSLESAESESEAEEPAEPESESESESEAEEPAEPESESESESEAEEPAEPEGEAGSDSEAEESAESESEAESESRSLEADETESQSKEATKSESQSLEAGATESQSKEAAERESLELAERERHDDQTNDNKDLETASAVNKPDKLSGSDSKTARGDAWMHKLSWTQLVADASSSSFSFSEILPTDTSEKQELPKCENNVFPDSKSKKFLAGDTSNPHGGFEEALVEKQDDADLNKDKITSDGDKKAEHNNRAVVRDVVISETCPFMRSKASVKEWTKAKAALNRSLKKKTKVKEMDSD